jgi:hypothetical protein
MKTLPWESIFITILSPYVAALSQFVSITTNEYNMREYFKTPPNQKQYKP